VQLEFNFTLLMGPRKGGDKLAKVLLAGLVANAAAGFYLYYQERKQISQQQDAMLQKLEEAQVMFSVSGNIRIRGSGAILNLVPVIDQTRH
jgi:hypothetical protein